MPIEIEALLPHAVEMIRESLQLAQGSSPAEFANKSKWSLAFTNHILVDAILAEWERQGGSPIAPEQNRASKAIRNKLSHLLRRVEPERIQDFVLKHYPRILLAVEKFQRDHGISLERDRNSEAAEEWVRSFDESEPERDPDDKDRDDSPSR